ncbi:MAG: hypothetical protein GY862_22550, partial [Gammaproteobacteria bacterium]|nr:hypothetical protein [Gammaproteobacteria bacterium]
VRDFLGIQLEISRVETEKSFSEPVGKVASRFDLFAEDEKNRIIVDIPHVRHDDHYHRFIHYHCTAVLQQAVNYTKYRTERTVFTIVVLTSGDWHKHDVSVVEFDPKTLQGQSLNEVSHKVLYICPKYLNKNTPEPYREWMRAIQDSLDGKVDETDYALAEVRKVFDLIENDTVSPEERAQMADERRAEDYATTKKAEGIAEGKTEGKAEEAKRTAKAMLDKGMDVKLITEITGLSQETLRTGF